MSGKKQNPDEEPKEGATPDEEPEEGATPDEEPEEGATPDEEPEEGATPVGKYKKEGPPDGKYKKEGPPDGKYKEGPPDDKYKKEGTPGDKSNDWKSKAKNAAIGATVGAALLVVGVPACIAGLGFTGAGIAAGSIAAKMMSVAAIANGGGVAAGSTVAVLQSIGAAGLSAGAQIGLASAGGSLGAAIGALVPSKKGPDDKPKKGGTPADKPEEVAMRNAGEVPDPEVLPGSLLSPPASQNLEP